MQNEIYLGKPDCGWVNITIGNFDCCASYVTDLPTDILKAGYLSLKEDYPFCLYLNLEANGEVELFSDYNTYIIYKSDKTYFFEYEISKENLIYSLVSSLKNNIHDWAKWDGLEDDEDDNEIMQNETELKALVEKIYSLKNNELLMNIDKIHTTELGIERIKKNLKLNTDDVINYLKNIIFDKECKIYKKGKNYYCETYDIKITINSNNYSIITAHLIENGE